MVASDALVMGSTAERLHDRFPAITKDRTDAFAVQSQQRYAAAWGAGKLQPDVVPVEVNTGEGWDVVTADEPPDPAPPWRHWLRCGRRSAPTDGSPPATRRA